MQEFENHFKIAVDIDGTLINGRCSNLLQQYIRDNHLTKEFHLITFRDNEQRKEVNQLFWKRDIKWEWFKSFHNLPSDLNEAWLNSCNQVIHIKGNQDKLNRALKYHKIDIEDHNRALLDITRWKGKVCSEIGCTILIDDMEELVLNGCEYYSVDFLHAITGIHKKFRKPLDRVPLIA